MRDIVGLYLHPPDHAIVLGVDEKSQIQALTRAADSVLDKIERLCKAIAGTAR